jgi:hypothetical protein
MQHNLKEKEHKSFYGQRIKKPLYKIDEKINKTLNYFFFLLYEIMSTVELGLGWVEVYETWRSWYHSKNQDDVKSAFNQFFDHQHFFASNSPTTNIPLSLGK